LFQSSDAFTASDRDADAKDGNNPVDNESLMTGDGSEGSGARFGLRRGPIFADICVVHNLDLAPAHTQAVLHQAMRLRNVSVQDMLCDLPTHHLVIATHQRPPNQAQSPEPTLATTLERSTNAPTASAGASASDTLQEEKKNDDKHGTVESKVTGGAEVEESMILLGLRDEFILEVIVHKGFFDSIARSALLCCHIA
jgi:hypothetical protein